MIEIIPAIDIMDASCVRLTRGSMTAEPQCYHPDPLSVAKRFEAAGMRRLHCVEVSMRPGSDMW
ncbi:MAG: HisA/HisF-related TIM barrel protein [Candidatus Marinimicrobia bacterium]|nr:HisA/HisF-related TIM barrel protein [Candidatus Neomarinimicrobiota bacterium]